MNCEHRHGGRCRGKAGVKVHGDQPLDRSFFADQRYKLAADASCVSFRRAGESPKARRNIPRAPFMSRSIASPSLP